jgi:hypothetical protein
MAQDVLAPAWQRLFTTTWFPQYIPKQLFAQLSHTWHLQIFSCLQQRRTDFKVIITEYLACNLQQDHSMADTTRAA